jgi:hypothetical protein
LQRKFLYSKEIIKNAQAVNDQIKMYETNPSAKKMSLNEYIGLFLKNKAVDENVLDQPSDIVVAHENRILNETDIHYEIYIEAPRMRTLKITFSDNVKFFPQVDGKFISTREWNRSYKSILSLDSLQESGDILQVIKNNLSDNNPELNALLIGGNLVDKKYWRNHCVFSFHYVDA